MGFFDDQHRDHLGKYAVAIRRYMHVKHRARLLELEAEKAVAAYQNSQDEATKRWLAAILGEAEPLILLIHEVEASQGFDTRRIYPTLRLMMDAAHLRNAFNQAKLR